MDVFNRKATKCEKFVRYAISVTLLINVICIIYSIKLGWDDREGIKQEIHSAWNNLKDIRCSIAQRM